jgi:hypothetical protein
MRPLSRLAVRHEVTSKVAVLGHERFALVTAATLEATSRLCVTGPERASALLAC